MTNDIKLLRLGTVCLQWKHDNMYILSVLRLGDKMYILSQDLSLDGAFRIGEIYFTHKGDFFMSSFLSERNITALINDYSTRR